MKNELNKLIEMVQENWVICTETAKDEPDEREMAFHLGQAQAYLGILFQLLKMKVNESMRP